MAACVFCERVLSGGAQPLLLDTGLTVVFEDAYPSTPGHVLVIPRRHVSRVLDLDEQEWSDLWSTARGELERLERRAPDAYTIGINDGPAAGQTVPHVHLHLIPRRHGDTADPRGGVRRAVPESAAYWISN